MLNQAEIEHLAQGGGLIDRDQAKSEVCKPDGSNIRCDMERGKGDNVVDMDGGFAEYIKGI